MTAKSSADLKSDLKDYTRQGGRMGAKSASTFASRIEDIIDSIGLTETIQLTAFAGNTNTATGNGAATFRVPARLNGYVITGVFAAVNVAGTTGTTDVQVRNETQTADVLSTVMTIDSSETDTSTAAAAAVIDTAQDDLTTGDLIKIDVDAISTTPAKGLIVELTIALPNV